MGQRWWACCPQRAGLRTSLNQWLAIRTRRGEDTPTFFPKLLLPIATGSSYFQRLTRKFHLPAILLGVIQ